MIEINLAKKQKNIIYLLQIFMSFIIFLISEAVCLIIISQIFSEGRITQPVLALSGLISIIFCALFAFLFAKSNLLFLKAKIKSESGGLRIENPFNFPLKVRTGIANLAKRNVGVRRPVYKYSLDFLKPPQEKIISPQSSHLINYPQNMPQGLYKDIIDTVRFAAAEISYGQKNIWVGWFEPNLAVFFSTRAEAAMGKVYKEIIRLCQKTHQKAQPSEEEIEKWLSQLT